MCGERDHLSSFTLHGHVGRSVPHPFALILRAHELRHGQGMLRLWLVLQGQVGGGLLPGQPIPNGFRCVRSRMLALEHLKSD